MNRNRKDRETQILEQEVQGRKAVEIKRTRDILKCLDSTKVYR